MWRGSPFTSPASVCREAKRADTVQRTAALRFRASQSDPSGGRPCRLTGSAACADVTLLIRRVAHPRSSGKVAQGRMSSVGWIC